MTRLLLLCCLGLAACAAQPQTTTPEPVSVDSAVALAETPQPPVELLREGDLLLDRKPPPFPDSVFADSLREVMRNGPYATPLIATEPYALDSLGQEVPLNEALRETAAKVPEGVRAFVQFIVAWDGTPFGLRSFE